MSDVTVLGMDEILKKLKKLPERVQKNVLTGAIRASAKPIFEEAKRLAPVHSGSLKNSIDVVKRKSKDKNIIIYSVVPRSSKRKTKRFTLKDGTKWKISGEVGSGWYAHFLEFGTSKMSAHPFMRPAFEKEGENTIKAAKEYMNKRIDKEIAKL